jgi:hypothetical protein
LRGGVVVAGSGTALRKLSQGDPAFTGLERGQHT